MISKSSSAAGLIPNGVDIDQMSPLSTSPAGIFAAVAAWYSKPMYKETVLDPWCKLTNNIWLTNRLESWNKILIPSVNPEIMPNKRGLYTILDGVYSRSLGRLGFKEEAAGKLRVFAFVDPFTQWLLKPLHNALFEILDLIPQDGTTDQLKPIKRLLSESPKGTPFYSFDLSAATDRLPVLLQMVLLSKILTSYGAQL